MYASTNVHTSANVYKCSNMCERYTCWHLQYVHIYACANMLASVIHVCAHDMFTNLYASASVYISVKGVFQC